MAIVVWLGTFAGALPTGFLLGWRSGWREHLVRCREDESAGRCGRCGHAIPPSRRNRDP